MFPETSDSSTRKGPYIKLCIRWSIGQTWVCAIFGDRLTLESFVVSIRGCIPIACMVHAFTLQYIANSTCTLLLGRRVHRLVKLYIRLRLMQMQRRHDRVQGWPPTILDEISFLSHQDCHGGEHVTNTSRSTIHISSVKPSKSKVIQYIWDSFVSSLWLSVTVVSVSRRCASHERTSVWLSRAFMQCIWPLIRS